MTNPALRSRFLNDPPPVRLGNLASSLARVSSCASRPAQHATVLTLLDECKHFIEWAGPEAEPDIQPELVRLQVELALWQLRWRRLQSGDSAARDLASTAREAADRVLGWSGLLDG